MDKNEFQNLLNFKYFGNATHTKEITITNNEKKTKL
jgi:hypothetical protein